jgi:glutamate 5-kinase
VIAIEGDFESQDVISINDTEGREIARGMVSCTKAELQDLMGRSPGGPPGQSTSGQKGRIFVPRDNIVILEQSSRSKD